MKICPNCEKSIPDNSEICPYCLHTFEAAKPSAAPKPKPIFDPISQPKSGENDDPGTEDIPSLGKTSYRKQWPVKRMTAIIILVAFIILVMNGILSGSSSKAENDDVMQEVAAAPVEAIPEPTAVISNETDEAEQEEDHIAEEEEYVFDDSNSRYLTEEDLDKLTPSELRIARNEIYARHHRLFDDESLQAYFNGCSWYEGRIPPDEFTEAYAASVFNEYELYNKDFILAYENSHK